MIDGLCYEMNGAPLRLRVENQLGYKHAKYIRSLEFVASFDKIASGKGGYWEDRLRMVRGNLISQLRLEKPGTIKT